MIEIFGIPSTALFGQLLIGLINGSFYALLRLGLAVIFGMLNIINFAHGALYMMGAFVAYLLLNGVEHRLPCRRAGRRPSRCITSISASTDWWALLLAPLIVGAFGVVLESAVIKAVQARPSLRPAADLRPRADHRGAGPQRVRLLRHALRDSRRAARRHESRLHVAAGLPRLGGGGRGGGCLGTWLVIEKTWLGSDAARGDRERAAGAGLRRQRAAADHADLRRRGGAGGLRRRAGGADLFGQPEHGRRTSSSPCSPWW